MRAYSSVSVITGRTVNILFSISYNDGKVENQTKSFDSISGRRVLN